jgi:serine/threonine protein kinase
MPIKPSEVIGEGSYGCIHRPSLICKDNKKVNYKHKISKLLLTENAISELQEYIIISESDKKGEFFLGVPDLCKVKPTENALKSVQKCKKLTKKNNNKPITKNQLKNYSVLVMKYGGIDLEKLGLEFGKMTATETNRNKAKLFWKETTRLFTGLAAFQKHDIVHFDIKPQNIVYDKKTGRLNFIDFGHMRKISDAITSCQNSKNGLTESAFWNYPFEVQFLNQDQFLITAQLTSDERNSWFLQFISNIKTHSNDDFTTAYDTFMDMFTEHMNNEEKMRIEELYKTDFFKTLNEQLMIEDYDDFLEKSIKTVDIYGIGLSLQYMLNYTQHLLSVEFVKKMSELCYLMTTPDVKKRCMVDRAIDFHKQTVSLL